MHPECNYALLHNNAMAFYQGVYEACKLLGFTPKYMGHFIHPFILLCPDCLYANILQAEKRNQEKGYGTVGG